MRVEKSLSCLTPARPRIPFPGHRSQRAPSHHHHPSSVGCFSQHSPPSTPFSLIFPSHAPSPTSRHLLFCKNTYCDNRNSLGILGSHEAPSSADGYHLQGSLPSLLLSVDDRHNVSVPLASKVLWELLVSAWLLGEASAGWSSCRRGNQSWASAEDAGRSGVTVSDNFGCPLCDCRKSRGGGSAGVVTQAALVILLVVCGGMGLMQLSSRAQVRDLKIHHEAVQEELTYTKNHLHHVEVRVVWWEQQRRQQTPCALLLPPSSPGCWSRCQQHTGHCACVLGACARPSQALCTHTCCVLSQTPPVVFACTPPLCQHTHSHKHTNAAPSPSVPPPSPPHLSSRRPSLPTRKRSTHTWHRRCTSTRHTTQSRSWRPCARR